MSKKVVLTIGTVLRGDDAAGPMLAKMMQDNPIAGWEVVDGGQMPEDELAVIRRMDPDILLVVDAAQMGEEAGRIRAIDEKQVVSDFLITTHSMPISFLLEELHECCDSVVFLGIQPAQMDFMGPLSPEVDEAVTKIYNWLKSGSDYLVAMGSI